MKLWVICILILLTAISCENKERIHPNAQLLTEISDSNYVNFIVSENKLEYTGDSIPVNNFKVLGIAQNKGNDFQLVLENQNTNPLLVMNYFATCACIHMDCPVTLFDFDTVDTLAFTFSTGTEQLPDYTQLKLYGNTEPIESNITLDLRKIKLTR